MTKKEMELAAEMLRDYSDLLDSRGCNDWDWPADWTVEERKKFAREFHEMNGDPEEFDGYRQKDFERTFSVLQDFCAASLLANKLEELSGGVPDLPEGAETEKP